MKFIIDEILVVLNTTLRIFDYDITLMSLICYCAVAALLLLVVYRLFD